MTRRHVHLAIETAAAVGRRKSPRIAVLVIDAVAASAAGVVFRRGNAVVWLAERIPPAFIRSG